MREQLATDVGLLTGCQDRPYAFGLATALASHGVSLDVVGSDDVDSPELQASPKLRFVNLWRGRRRHGGPVTVWSLAAYYGRLIRYAARSRPRVVHILWNNRLEYFDRTLLMLYYKLQGKKIVLTAHNVNQGKRDSDDSVLNRLTLRIQYRLVDHIFVHTAKMKTELLDHFGVQDRSVTVIKHPINNAFRNTDLTAMEAKRQLGISADDKTLLFLGRISPYKGLEYLLSASHELATRNARYRLIIAGEPKKGNDKYLAEIYRRIHDDFDENAVLLKDHFIPDNEMEVYLKAADVLVLPYKDISQSGVLFLAHTFGLPVIAADVGSFHETIVEQKTGLLFRPEDPADLVRAIEAYFASDLFRHLSRRREEIREHFRRCHSWHAVAQETGQIYQQLMRQ
jgi:glycosyltransferase involved in cell wall biosynthesis